LGGPLRALAQRLFLSSVCGVLFGAAKAQPAHNTHHNSPASRIESKRQPSIDGSHSRRGGIVLGSIDLRGPSSCWLGAPFRMHLEWEAEASIPKLTVHAHTYSHHFNQHSKAQPTAEQEQQRGALGRRDRRTNTPPRGESTQDAGASVPPNAAGPGDELPRCRRAPHKCRI
jgi:hypothetical protein